MQLTIRELSDDDRPWLAPVIAEEFGSVAVVSRGVLHDSLALPGLVADLDGQRAGVAIYRVEGDECEVVVLISLLRRRGVASRLILSLLERVSGSGCKRVWLVTTNNNVNAIAFYRATGWRQVAVHAGAVALARKLKPEIPLVDDEGRALVDEVEFEQRF